MSENVLTVLKALEDLEQRMADLYAWYHEVFGDNVAAADFFYKMSVDEISHRDVIRFQNRVAQQNFKLFETVEIDLKGLSGFVGKIDAMFSRTPSLREAAIATRELEQSVYEVHYRNAIAQANPFMTKLLVGLNKYDRRHRADIDEFGVKCGFWAPSPPPPDAEEIAELESVDVDGDVEKI